MTDWRGFHLGRVDVLKLVSLLLHATSRRGRHGILQSCLV